MFDPTSYITALQYLIRMLGGIYLFAFGALLFQVKGLLGSAGILPIHLFLDSFRHIPLLKRLLYIPTVFWIGATNAFLLGVTGLGVILAIALVFGISPSFCLAALFILYLSIVVTGQEFLSFGWEGFLLEITFYTFWCSLTPVPNLMMWLCLNFLLFRFHVQAGAVKIQSRDPAWRDLSALSYHYLTQPLPNTWAWYVYHWPTWIHQFSTAVVLFTEIVVPFGLFFSESIRFWTGIILISLQLCIWLTGNLSFLNHLTVAFVFISFSNNYLYSIDIADKGDYWVLDSFIGAFGAIFLLLQVIRFGHHFKPDLAFFGKWMGILWGLSFFHLVNRYGLFAVMTKKRYEVVVEGSQDGVVWKEYMCWFKPSEISRRPRRISPFQPRLDWQMWFLPFDDFAEEAWFHQFLYHLLKGSPDVLTLVRVNPFPDAPPKYVRAVMYDYTFTTKQQRKETGCWWNREFMGSFSPVLTLKHQDNL